MIWQLARAELIDIFALKKVQLESWKSVEQNFLKASKLRKDSFDANICKFKQQPEDFSYLNLLLILLSQNKHQNCCKQQMGPFKRTL